MFVETELRDDSSVPLVPLLHGRKGFVTLELGCIKLCIGPLQDVLCLEHLEQVRTVPLQFRLHGKELLTDAPLVSFVERQRFLLLRLVLLGRVAERFVALKLRRLISLRGRKAQGVQEADFFGGRILLRNMIRYDHIIFELIRLVLHCDHALNHLRRSYALRFGLRLPILADVFINV